ncbi:MAG: glycosyltransferase family 4 protein [Ignavibacteriales bacterium]|nr:glycosyltransferase family 4 protein [Ignavibacteriales bacterium]
MKKRILFVDEDQQRNGSTVSLEYLVKGFHSRGYDTFVLTWKKDPGAKSVLKQSATLIDGTRWGLPSITLHVHFVYDIPVLSWSGLKSVTFDSLKFFLGIMIVFKTIRETQPDVVYINEYSVVQASIASWLSGKPSVAHIRSQLLNGTFGIRRFLLSRLMLTTNKAIFAITEREANQLHWPVNQQHRIHVVGEFFSHTGLTVHDSKKCKEAFGLPLDRSIITMLGGIKDIKGTIDFLRAAEIVVSKNDRVVFVIAGSDYKDGNSGRRAYFHECMRIVDSLKKKGSVRMLGAIGNSLDLILASDIVVSPSPRTHFSRPVIEAWGLGKPVIATRTDHMQDLVTQGTDAFLVDAGDHDSLASCLSTLLVDEQLRDRLGVAGKSRVAEEFDADKNIQRIVDICDSLVSQKNG